MTMTMTDERIEIAGEVDPPGPQVEITPEIDELLCLALIKARDEFIMASTSEKIAVVRNYCADLEGLSDAQIINVIEEIESRFRCRICFRLIGDRGYCEWED